MRCRSTRSRLQNIPSVILTRGLTSLTALMARPLCQREEAVDGLIHIGDREVRRVDARNTPKLPLLPVIIARGPFHVVSVASDPKYMRCWRI